MDSNNQAASAAIEHASRGEHKLAKQQAFIAGHQSEYIPAGFVEYPRLMDAFAEGRQHAREVAWWKRASETIAA